MNVDKTNIIDFLIEQRDKQTQLNFLQDLSSFERKISEDLQCHNIEDNKFSTDLFKVSNQIISKRNIIYLDLEVAKIKFRPTCHQQLQVIWNKGKHPNCFYINFYELLVDNLDLIIEEINNPTTTYKHIICYFLNKIFTPISEYK